VHSDTLSASPQPIKMQQSAFMPIQTASVSIYSNQPVKCWH